MKGLTVPLFWKISAICALVIALGRCYAFGLGLPLSNPGDVVADVASIIWNFLLFFFFRLMGKKTEEQEEGLPSTEEMQKMVQDFNALERSKKHKQRKV